MVRVWSELSKDEKAWLLRPWGSRGQRICKEKWAASRGSGSNKSCAEAGASFETTWQPPKTGGAQLSQTAVKRVQTSGRL
jgi:hypothetical protein